MHQPVIGATQRSEQGLLLLFSKELRRFEQSKIATLTKAIVGEPWEYKPAGGPDIDEVCKLVNMTLEEIPEDRTMPV